MNLAENAALCQRCFGESEFIGIGNVVGPPLKCIWGTLRLFTGRNTP